MDVSENRGTPKSSILIGFSIINHPFWDTPIFGNTHIRIHLPCCLLFLEGCDDMTSPQRGREKMSAEKWRHANDFAQDTRIYDRGCLRITTSRKDSWAWWLFGTWCFTCPQCYVFGILIVPRVLMFDMHVTWEASTSAIVRTIPVPRSMNPKHQSVLDMTWMLLLHFLARRRSNIELTNKTMALATDQLNLWGLKLNVPKPKSTKSESNFNIVVFPFESVCWANLAIFCVWKYLYLSSWVSGEFVEFWSFRKVNVAIILADLQPCIITGPRQRLDQRRAVTLFFVSSLTTVNPKHNNENKTEIQTNSKIMRLL